MWHGICGNIILQYYTTRTIKQQSIICKASTENLFTILYWSRIDAKLGPISFHGKVGGLAEFVSTLSNQVAGGSAESMKDATST
jgi:hypothetical protein